MLQAFRFFILLILFFKFCESFKKCYLGTHLYYKDEHCELNYNNYEELARGHGFCSNIAFVGYHKEFESHMFLINDGGKMSLAKAVNSGNIGDKPLDYPDLENYNFKCNNESVLSKDALVVICLSMDDFSYYVLNITHLDTNNKVYPVELYDIGKIVALNFLNLNCENPFYFTIENKTVLVTNILTDTGLLKQYENLNYEIIDMKYLSQAKWEIKTVKENYKRSCCQKDATLAILSTTEETTIVAEAGGILDSWYRQKSWINIICLISAIFITVCLGNCAWKLCNNGLKKLFKSKEGNTAINKVTAENDPFLSRMSTGGSPPPGELPNNNNSSLGAN